YSTEFQAPSWTNPNHADIVSKSQEFILFGGANPANGKKYPIIFNPGTGWNGYMTVTGSDFGNYSPLWDYADTVRWTHGKHSFSAGAEYRRPTTTGYVGSSYVPGSVGNAPTTLTNQFFSSTGAIPQSNAALFGNFLNAARGNPGTLLNTLNGAVGVGG